MSEQRKVTVVLTVHDIKLGYLVACLTSLAFQKYKNFEILIIDDCSSMDYSFLKEPFKPLETQPALNIRYVRNETNLGLNASVNKAFSMIQSEYVIRLGSDDLFHEDMLQKEVDFLDKNPDYIACCCGLQMFGRKDNYIHRDREWTLNCNLRTKANDYGYGGGMLFRSKALAYCRIDSNLKMCEDFDFHLTLLEHGKIHGIDEPLYQYRQHEGNHCRTISNTERKQFLVYIFRKHHVNDDLISILMPVHNTNPMFVSDCLESLKKQTYKKFEIIFFDDGSSVEYKNLSAYKALRKNIRYYRNEVKQGISNTLNFACERAHGEYLVRVDSDDICDKEFLEREITFLKENQNYIGVCCNLKQFGLTDEIIYRPTVFDINSVHDRKSAHGYGYGCGMMFRRKALESCFFDPAFVVCEDFDFHLQLLKVGKIKGLGVLYYYRQYETSTIHQYNNKQRFELINRILDKHGLRK